MNKFNIQNFDEGWKKILDNVLALNDKDLFMQITEELKKLTHFEDDPLITRDHFTGTTKTSIINYGLCKKDKDNILSLIESENDIIGHMIVKVHDLDLPEGAICPPDTQIDYVELRPEEMLYFSGYIKGYFNCKIQAQSVVKDIQNSNQQLINRMILDYQGQALDAYRSTINMISTVRNDTMSTAVLNVLKERSENEN